MLGPELGLFPTTIWAAYYAKTLYKQFSQLDRSKTQTTADAEVDVEKEEYSSIVGGFASW